MTYVYSGDNPSELYLTALKDLVNHGVEYSPRGKKILELRPVVFQFTNPLNRVTFLNKRRINPFFQMAESWWILSGRADVGWLSQFNSNMVQFSDDGEYFNAPYGERLRSWNKNALHNIIINPIDQLYDVYTKLVNDMDTRQAIIVLYNPMFDNSSYTIQEKGKDIACNTTLSFKIRDNLLHMTIFNRSNDIHWGLFGANLCQFSTIQEMLTSALREHYPQLNVGTYTHITDSLHMYIDDYSGNISKELLDNNLNIPDVPIFQSEPRMSLSFMKFSYLIEVYWNLLDYQLSKIETPSQVEKITGIDSYLYSLYTDKFIDDYWYFVFQSTIIYRLAKLHRLPEALYLLSKLPNCQWKVSMLFFLQKFIKNIKDNELDLQKSLNFYEQIAKSLTQESPNLESYLKM